MKQVRGSSKTYMFNSMQFRVTPRNSVQQNSDQKTQFIYIFKIFQVSVRQNLIAVIFLSSGRVRSGMSACQGRRTLTGRLGLVYECMPREMNSDGQARSVMSACQGRTLTGRLGLVCQGRTLTGRLQNSHNVLIILLEM